MEDMFMLREFVQLIDEAVDEGFERGLNLFMEGLEEDLAKDEVITESGSFDAYVAVMMERDGIPVEILEENIDETKLDAALKELKKEGILG